MNNKFYSGSSLAFDDAHIFGGVKYTWEINPDEDFYPGTVAMAEIVFTVDFMPTIGTSYTYKVVQEDQSAETVGIFTIREVNKNNYGKWEVTANDNAYKLDKEADSIVNNQNYANINAFMTALATHCGIQYESFTLTNGTFPWNSGIYLNHVSCRQMLEYVGQIAGCNFRFEPNGKLNVVDPTSTSVATFTRNNYKDLIVADYSTDITDKVWFGVNEDDVGVSYGNGTNALRFTYNPLMWVDSTHPQTSYVQNIYNKFHSSNNSVYVPVEFKCFKDLNVKVGDRITVKLADNSNVSSYVFSKSWNNTGVSIKSVGNKTRDQYKDTTDSEVKSLAGKYNILKRDIDSTVSEIGELQNGIADHETRITQNANAIIAEASSRESGDSELSGRITVNSNAITAEATSRTNADTALSGRIDVQAGKVAILVDDNKNVKAGIIVDAINDAGSTVKIDADHIELSGDVVMKSNLTDGTTTISGNNIKTGTISASYLSGNGLNVSNATIGNCTINNQCTVNGTLYGPINISSGSNTVLKTGEGDTGLGIKVHEVYSTGPITSTSDGLFAEDLTYNGGGTSPFGYPGHTSNTGLANVVEWLVDNSGGGGEPDQYIKNASVSGNTLTLTKKDGSTVTFTKSATAVFG